MWLALRTEIGLEFAEHMEPLGLAFGPGGARLESQRRRSDPAAWAWEYAQEKRRRRQRRLARAAARPPCPHCKGMVKRLGPTAKIPTYCSDKCMRAARWKRWYKKHGAERNAQRRKK